MTRLSNGRPTALLAPDRGQPSRRRLDWLSRQCPSFVDAFLAHAVPVRVDAGRVIVRADDIDCGVIGIVEGSVAVRLRSRRGVETLVSLRQAGYWCGRCDLVALTPLDFVIAARVTTHLLHVPSDHVRRILLDHPSASQALAELASEEAQALTTLLDVAFERRPIARLARKLLQTAGAEPGEPLRLTQDDVAEMTSLSRGTVNRLLAELAATGAITTAYGRLAIADRTRLLHAAGLAAADDAVAARPDHATAAGVAAG